MRSAASGSCAGEDAAAELDADSEDDVLALTRALDLRELVEDELLLACRWCRATKPVREPLTCRRPSAEAVEERPNPFAALAALKAPGAALRSSGADQSAAC